MTLHVEFENFADAVKSHLGNAKAYIGRRENRTHVSAADPKSNTLISASTSLNMADASKLLEKSGMSVEHGGWSEAAGGATDALGELPYVAAVAYKSSEDMPGLWMDAYEIPPTPAVVLKAIYDEFRQTGEVGDMTFEEFIRLASPNVAIVGPTEIERFLSDKAACE